MNHLNILLVNDTGHQESDLAWSAESGKAISGSIGALHPEVILEFQV